MTNDPKNGAHLEAMPQPDDQDQFNPDLDQSAEIERDYAEEAQAAQGTGPEPEQGPGPNPPPPKQAPLREATDFLKILGSSPAVYSNFFLSMFTPEGIRIMFGESFGSANEGATARCAILINLETALKLNATLTQSIQAIMGAKQQQMQQALDMIIGKQMTPTAPAPIPQPGP